MRESQPGEAQRDVRIETASPDLRSQIEMTFADTMATVNRYCGGKTEVVALPNGFRP